MTNPSAPTALDQIGALLRGDSAEMAGWVSRREAKRMWFCLAAVMIGAGLLGASVGAWRSPLQAVYAGIKFPMVILLTTAGTVLLNSMLAPLLGLNLKFRESLLLILSGHSIAAIILGGFSPIVFFVVRNAPPIQSPASASRAGHDLVLLVEVGLIAFAGIVGNVRLRRQLDSWSGRPGLSSRVMLAWLAVNLFFGAQISWLLRPFVGAPGLPVEFLRPDAFHGNFYETVFHTFTHMLNS